MTGKAQGAVHILSVIQMQASPASPDFNRALDQNKPVAVYCASGAPLVDGDPGATAIRLHRRAQHRRPRPLANGRRRDRARLS
ncbi:MAG: hypothetical protein R3D59_17620 [Paracoccaceae bacterium]